MEVPIIGNPAAGDPAQAPAIPGTQITPPAPQPVSIDPQAAPAGLPNPLPPPAPDLIDFHTPGGQVFKIERGLYDMLTAREPAQPPQPQPQSQQAQTDYQRVWYTDPNAAANMVAETVAKQLRAEYQQAEAARTFWQGFRSAHPDLQRVPNYVVDNVVRQHGQRLRHLSDAEGFRQLGDLVRTELFTMGLGSGQNAPAQPPVLSEGQYAGRVTPQPQVPQPAQEPATIGSILQQMRAKRRAGFMPPQSNTGA